MENYAKGDKPRFRSLFLHFVHGQDGIGLFSAKSAWRYMARTTAPQLWCGPCISTRTLQKIILFQLVRAQNEEINFEI